MMDFLIATIGELVIVELCVLWIWLKVLIDAIRNRDVAPMDRKNVVAHRRLLLTSLGLVFNATAITGIMAFRMAEYLSDFWPFVPGIVVCYILLAIGNIMFIISAALATPHTGVLKTFIMTTLLWTLFCVIAWHQQWSIV